MTCLRCPANDARTTSSFAWPGRTSKRWRGQRAFQVYAADSDATALAPKTFAVSFSLAKRWQDLLPRPAVWLAPHCLFEFQ